jgi:YidC/Oxa1 family membrane protein insertase
MGMDRNTVIGFVLIGLLMFGMFYFNSRSQQAKLAEDKRIQDSIAKTKPKVDTALAKIDSLRTDSIRRAQAVTSFVPTKDTAEVVETVENEVLKIVFTNKGGQPKTVELKNFKTYNGKPLVLENGSYNKISYALNVNGKQAQSADMFFSAAKKTVNADKSQTIVFAMNDSAGKEILSHHYIIKPNDYLLDFTVNMTGADKLVSQNTLNLLWQTEAPLVEKTVAYEKQQTHIGYVKNGDFDFEYLGSGDDKQFKKPVEWLGLKQQFFVTAIAAKNKFETAEAEWKSPNDSLGIVAQMKAICRVSIPAGQTTASVPMQLLYGPSDYNVLKAYGNQMQNVVPYGNGVFAFVKYINRHFLLPIWDFLRKYIGSYGIVILLLTLIIRLITSPILYKSYLSGAKMKALKPELDELKKKFTDPRSGEMDRQGFSMEQMKLWKTAGVSPLGGCLPALLQIPIFMSLYYFFQANISLRGESFLWAKDLATYDSIAQLPFSIPFYGDHVSLFTLTATLTSLLISLYSMSSMQDNSNPVMKYMPYIFPILLLGVFNSLPAALTWYYTVSNTITLLLQFIIQNYVINHDKIRAQIEENKKKPVKQSKFQERLQAMQETQKKVQEMRNKQQGKK